MHGKILKVDWVTLGAWRMAAVLPLNQGEVGRRILLDQEMWTIWQDIKKAKIAVDRLPGWQRLTNYGISASELKRGDIACGAFFAAAVNALNRDWPIVTQTYLTNEARRRRDMAKLCSEVLADDALPADPERRRILSEALECVRVYFMETVNDMHHSSGPLIFEKPSGKRNDDSVRVKVKALAKETANIFGQFRRGTILVTVRVGLGVDITDKDVENWCNELPAPEPLPKDDRRLN